MQTQDVNIIPQGIKVSKHRKQKNEKYFINKEQSKTSKTKAERIARKNQRMSDHTWTK